MSFQANKAEGESRWFKYKEGFSGALMRYVFEQVGLERGRLLDPFAGAGTALFEAAGRGLDAMGIELLPSSLEAIAARCLLRERPTLFAGALRAFRVRRAWEEEGPECPFAHLVITSGAFPPENERRLCRYLHEAAAVPDAELARVLRFAAMCVLEAISYTRKDGQYLRWDHRSGRRQGAKPFDKGVVCDFTEAVDRKLTEIERDLHGGHGEASLFDAPTPAQPRGCITLLAGSCLELLPTLTDSTFDGLVTSPPYANRYDYTRTYALELALMGAGEEEIRRLRQAMLSCTVENKAKENLSQSIPAARFQAATAAFAEQAALQAILEYLEACRTARTINNTGIPRMVRGYFFEMALVIFESARVLKPGAPLVMVNDNVRYMGAHVPVDLILSDFAQSAGLRVETIWVLPRGKGNSSQQMGAHGREEVRKCVYVWRKP